MFFYKIKVYFNLRRLAMLIEFIGDSSEKYADDSSILYPLSSSKVFSIILR